MKAITFLVMTLFALSANGQRQLVMLLNAEKHLTQGDSTKAINSFKTILVKYPNSFNAAHRLSEVYFTQKDYYNSLQYTNVALDMLENRLDQLEHSSHEGANPLIVERKQQFKKDKAKAHLLKGHIRKAQGRFQDAKTEFEKSLEYHRTVQAAVDMALLLTNQGQTEKAKYLLLQMDTDTSESMIVPFNLGNVYFKERKYDSALLQYEKAISRNANYRLAHLYSGIAHSKLEQYQQSANSYGRYLKIDSTSEEVYFRRAVIYNQLAKPDSALMHWSKVISINPKNTEAWRNRGLTYFKQADYEKAITDFNEALALAPDQAYTRINQGYSYYLLNQPKKALSDLNEGLKGLPKYNLGYYFRALVHLQTRKKKEACKDLKKALDLGLDESEVDKRLWKKCR